MTGEAGRPAPVVGLDHPSLRDRTGRGVTVAVIDSGIHASHPHVGGVAGGAGMGADGEVTEDFADRLGHGTAVAAAIKDKAPGVALYGVKVFHDALSTSVDALVRAVDWASSRGITLVNLSLGTPRSDRREALEEAVERARRRGSVVVSPAEHDGVRWLPGSLPHAVGVACDPACGRHEIRIVSGPGGTDVVAASGYPRPIPGIDPERNLQGISFAAANVTGFLARWLEGYDGRPTAEWLLDRVRAAARLA